MKYIMICLLMIFPLSTMAAPKKISLDFSYKSLADDISQRKAVVKTGERLETHYKRGDIDTFISMAPRYEIREGQKVILIDFEIQNMRDGDLISESSAQVLTHSGQKAELSLEDDQLEDTLTLAITPKSL